jgi:hypothetical protein
VQVKDDQVKTILFHFSLVKLLVLEELKKLNKDWDYFLASTRISLDPKGDTPLSDEKRSPLIPEESKRREKRFVDQGREKGKEVEGASPSQQAKKEGKNYTLQMRLLKCQNLAVQLQDQQPKDFLPCTHNLLNIQLKVLVKISFSHVKKMKELENCKNNLRKLIIP